MADTSIADTGRGNGISVAQYRWQVIYKKDASDRHLLDAFPDINDPREHERIRWDDIFGPRGSGGLNDESTDPYDTV